MAVLKLSELSWTQLAGIAVAILTLWKVVAVYAQYRKLAHIKGPLIASLTPFWLFYHTCKGDIYAACQKNLLKYGSPLRIAPNIITTDDPAAYRTWLAPKSQWTRGPWYDGMKFDPREHNLLSMRDEKQHSERRQKLIPGYTGSDVPDLEADIDKRVVELVASIKRFATKSQSFDFALVAHYFTLDILTQIGFGEAMGYLPKNEDIFQYIEMSSKVFPIMELGANFPSILKVLTSPLMAGAQPKPTDKFGFGAILGHAHEVINQRLAPGAKPKNDMIGSFLKNGLSKTELECESILLIIAGADSTATALRNTFLYIMTSPPVYAKLQKEIDAAVNQVTSPVISNSEAQALPYLRAVILEGLRMFMPLTGLAGKLPPKGGIVLQGVYIPEDTEIGLSTYSMLRRRDLFGDDAETFRPERWIDNDEATIKAMERNHSLIFGAGRVSCLGKNIAYMELRKAVFEVFRAFDLVAVNPLHPIKIRSNGAVVQKDMYVRAYEREAIKA